EARSGASGREGSPAWAPGYVWTSACSWILRVRGTRLVGAGTRPTSICRSALRPLSSVLGPPLAPVVDAGAVQGAPNGVVANARQVLHATAADHHHRVLLQVVPLAADVA